MSSRTVYVDSANIARIEYVPSTAWHLEYYYNQSAVGIYDGTLALTSTAARFSLEFIGTQVQVYGSLSPEQSASDSPISYYYVDNQPMDAYEGVVPASETTQQNGVNFFDSGPLLNGSHTLEVNVTWDETSSNSYMLDYIAYTVLDPAEPAVLSSVASSASSTGSASSPSAASSTSSVSSGPTHTSSSSGSLPEVVGGAVGGIGVLAAVVVVFFFWWRHRRHERDKARIPVSPYNPGDSNDDWPMQYRSSTAYAPSLLGPGDEIRPGEHSVTDGSSFAAWNAPAELSALSDHPRGSLSYPSTVVAAYAVPSVPSPLSGPPLRPPSLDHLSYHPSPLRPPSPALSTPRQPLLAHSAANASATSLAFSDAQTPDDKSASTISFPSQPPASLPGPALARAQRMPASQPERDSGLRFAQGVVWPDDGGGGRATRV